MAYFKIRYKRGHRKHSLTLEAKDRSVALAEFTQRDLGIPLAITQTSKPLFAGWRDRPLVRSRRSISYSDLIAAYRQIGTMFDAGIPITTILDEVHTFTENPHLKQIWEAAKSGVESGKTLTEALSPFEESIGRLSLAMIQLGEATGTLGEAIIKLADFLETIDDNRRKLIRATRYPLSLIHI